jgi:hypothetical protein
VLPLALPDSSSIDEPLAGGGGGGGPPIVPPVTDSPVVAAIAFAICWATVVLPETVGLTGMVTVELPVPGTVTELIFFSVRALC